jgi:hypothetical protein
MRIQTGSRIHDLSHMATPPALREQRWRCHMREVAGSTLGLDFYLLCEPICVSLRLFGYNDIIISYFGYGP